MNAAGWYMRLTQGKLLALHLQYFNIRAIIFQAGDRIYRYDFQFNRAYNFYKTYF